MKISFPHMGNLYIIFTSLFKLLGGEVIVPPYNNKETLSIGSKISPEAICLPYKLVLGNYVQAIEKGAEAILMINSPGSCRLGQYSGTVKNALTDLGYNIQFIDIDFYNYGLIKFFWSLYKVTGNSNPITIVNAIRVTMVKIKILDHLNKILSYYRAREITPGTSDKNYNKALNLIEDAMSINECKKACKEIVKSIKQTTIDKNKKVVYIDLTGEIYVVLDSFSNLEIEKELGLLGVQVHRRINLSEWINASVTPKFLRKRDTHEQRATKNAKEFLTRDIGGDAIESVGDAALAGKNKSAGIIHLLPFTCMPEIISQNILPNVRNKKNIPILSLVLDEQMGKAGYITRLEAFVDLVKRNNVDKNLKPVNL